MFCKLCQNNEEKTFLESQDKRVFYLCNLCKLIFCNNKQLPNINFEKERYLQHNNSPHDIRYRNFLLKAIQPALEFINTKMEGLDYGCGPVPVTSLIMAENNILCNNYDPIFFPEKPVKKFDFVIATECFEHFHFPFDEITNIVKLLKPNGFLIIMTEFWTDISKFQNWYYSRDPTHVSFYHKKTMEYICKKFGFQKKYKDAKSVIILKYNS